MWIDGAPAKIGGRAFAVLLAFVERRGRVVSKQELMDLVWPNLVVEENNPRGSAATWSAKPQGLQAPLAEDMR